MQFWGGYAEGVVQLSPTFSPHVDGDVQGDIRRREDTLRNAKGGVDSIFCGPLKKGWVYKTESHPANGPRVADFGFERPVWVRVEDTEQDPYSGT